jgi:hypothetical protein
LELNNSLETVPSSWIGNLFGFRQEEFFKATDEEKEDISVKF